MGSAMTIQNVPALVLALSGKVNMTPIAWKITPDEVVIVFEQGPLMTFNRDQVLDVVEPVIHNIEEAFSFAVTPASRGGSRPPLASPVPRGTGEVKPLPKKKPRK